MNDKAVYRTAPATPGLLIIDIQDKEWGSPLLLKVSQQPRLEQESRAESGSWWGNHCTGRGRGEGLGIKTEKLGSSLVVTL